MKRRNETPVKLSLDARIVAKGFWTLPGTAVTFRRPRVLHERTTAALSELVGAGLITSEVHSLSGAVTYTPKGKRGIAALTGLAASVTVEQVKANSWPVMEGQ